MRFMNEWQLNTIVPDRKTIICQLFGCYLYNPFFVVVTELRDVSANVAEHLGKVKTLLTNIHVSLAK